MTPKPVMTASHERAHAPRGGETDEQVFWLWVGGPAFTLIVILIEVSTGFRASPLLLLTAFPLVVGMAMWLRTVVPGPHWRNPGHWLLLGHYVVGPTWLILFLLAMAEWNWAATGDGVFFDHPSVPVLTVANGLLLAAVPIVVAVRRRRRREPSVRPTTEAPRVPRHPATLTNLNPTLTQDPWPVTAEGPRAHRTSDPHSWDPTQGDSIYWLLWLVGPVIAGAGVALVEAGVARPLALSVTPAVALNIVAAGAYLGIAFEPRSRWRSPLHWCLATYFVAMGAVTCLWIGQILHPEFSIKTGRPLYTGTVLWLYQWGLPAAAALGGICFPLAAAVRVLRRTLRARDES